MVVKRTARRKTSHIPKQGNTSIPSADVRQAWLLIQSLTCALIAKLEGVLKTHDASEDGWERLFGAKDSTVINLQKLVAVLGEISDRLAQESDVGIAPEMRMEAGDMAMLQRWLEQELAQVTRDD